jgi:hypothetical protein
MEHMFLPTRRLQDRWEEVADLYYDVELFENYTEVQLVVPVEVFLDYRWDWADLWAFASGDDAERKIMWITDEEFLTFGDNSDITNSVESFVYDSLLLAASTIPSGHIQTLQLFGGEDSDFSEGGYEVFWRAVATSNCNSIKMIIRGDYLRALPDAPILAQFLLERPSLQVLDFQSFFLTDAQCCALATLQRKDLEVTLSDCTLVHSPGAHNIFTLSGLTELKNCRMGSLFLSALSGNKYVKRLSFRRGQLTEDNIHSLARALPTNHGIEQLSFQNLEVTDETWILFFRSLSSHPLIEVLSLGKGRLRLSAESMTTRTHAILQILHLNTVVQTIQLPDDFETGELYQNSILPRLEMNRSCFEVQRQAVKRADPCIRSQLLGRALHVVQDNPNLVFRLLLENVPAFVGTEEKEDVAVAFMEQDPIGASVSGSKRKALS